MMCIEKRTGAKKSEEFRRSFIPLLIISFFFLLSKVISSLFILFFFPVISEVYPHRKQEKERRV
jgi:hypothetical protein